MKRGKIYKALSLILAFTLSIPMPVFADNQTEISGQIEQAVLDVSTSLNATYTINPNDESGNYFTANNIEIINNSNMPISIAVKDIASDNTFTDVLPDSVGSKEDWYKLAYNDSNSKIAVGLKYVSGDFIEQNQTDTLYFKSILDATEAIPIGSIGAKSSLIYSLDGFHGLSFSESKSHVTDITWEFSLYDGSESDDSINNPTGEVDSELIESLELSGYSVDGFNTGNTSGNYNYGLLLYEFTDTNESASAASVLMDGINDLFGVHSVAADSVIYDDIDDVPIDGTAIVTGTMITEGAEYRKVNEDGSIGELIGVFRDGTENIVIPDFVLVDKNKLYRVVDIKEKAFSDTDIILEEYKFSDCIKTFTLSKYFPSNTIKDYGLGDCDYLEKYIIPKELADRVETIDDYAFSHINISTLDFPNLKHIGDYAFATTYFEGNYVSDLSFLNGVETIGDYAFANCKNVEEIDLSTVKSIGSHIFANTRPNGLDCTNTLISSISLNSATEIKEGALVDLPNLQSVSFGNGITDIPNGYFSGYTNIKNITLSGNIKSIGEEAFIGCNNLSEVIINDGLESIGTRAFAGTNITEITIPEGTKIIGDGAFDGCDNLSEVIINDGLESIGTRAFAGTSLNDINIPISIQSIGDYAFAGTNITEIEFPEGFASLGNYVFYGCEKLTKVTLPSTITNESIYLGCNPRVTIVTPNEEIKNKIMDIIPTDGILTYKDNGDNTYSVLGVADELYTGEIIIPDTFNDLPVVSIEAEAFNACKSSKIVMSDNITSIGEKAFYNSSITAIEISKNLETISDFAFQYCRNLTEVLIPEGVKYINQYAFNGCSSLKNIYIPNSIKTVGSNAFYNIASGSTIYADTTVQSKFIAASNSGYNYNSSYTTVTTENMQDSTFTYIVRRSSNTALVSGLSNTSATAIVIPEYVEGFKVTGVASSAFKSKTTIKTVDASYISEIGTYAFRGCTNLTSVTLGNNLTNIGAQSFYGCTKISNLIIPSSVTSIGSFAFKNVPCITNNSSCTDSSNWGATSAK